MTSSNNKIVAVAVGLILLAAVLFVLVSLHGNSELTEPVVTQNSETSNAADISSQDLTKTTEDNVAASALKLADKSKDFSALIAVSRERELCLADMRVLKSSRENINGQLSELLNSANYSTGELQRVLKYLVDAAIIDFHEAAQAMDYFYLRKSEQRLPSYTGEEPKNMPEDHPVAALFLELNTLLEAQDKAGLLDYWQRLDKSVIRGLGTSKTPDYQLGGMGNDVSLQITIDAMMPIAIKQLENSDFAEWLIDNIALDASGVATAIEADFPVDVVQRLLKNMPEQHVPVSTRTGQVFTPLLSATMKGHHGLVETILSTGRFRQPTFTIPPNNRYLATMLSTVEPDEGSALLQEDQLDMLTLFTANKRPLVFVRDARTIRLLGYPALAISKEVRAQLRQSNISGQVLSRATSLDETRLPSTDSQIYSELALRASDIAVSTANLKKTCDSFRKEQSALMPGYDGKETIASLIPNHLAFPESLARLREISPVLVDLYYQQGMAALSAADQIAVDSALSQLVSNQQLTDYDTLLKNLGPHQQHHLAVGLCEQLNDVGLQIIMQQGIYFDYLKPEFYSCRFEMADDATDLDLKRFIESHDGALSRMVRALNNYRLDEAITLASQNQASHGFDYGRDALAILLEQLILHGDNDIEKRRKLLEILLGVTELQDMHFRRLHRLQLKWPLMFEALSQQFSAILAAPNYPLNLYQGL